MQRSDSAKRILIIPILCLAVLCVMVELRPTTAQILANGMPRKSASLAILMPPKGAVLKLPNRDLFERPIEAAEDRAVVAMPTCQSCTVRHINWPTLKSLSHAPIVLVFPDKPDSKYPEIHSSQFRVLVEGKKPIFSARLHDFAPNCVWLDKVGRVLRSQPTFGLDGSTNGRPKS